MRPAAGALGLVVHPTQGAWKSMQKMWAKEQEQYQRKTRLSDGAVEVHSSTNLEREEILENFKTVKLTTKTRQKKYKDVAEKEMFGNQHNDLETDRYTETDTAQVSSSALSGRIARTSPSPRLVENDDAAFERDLDLAKQLSIAEQRGYERGLAANL